MRRRPAALAVLVALLLAGCGGMPPQPSIPVGATTDPVSTLSAQLYAAALRYYGSAAHVETRGDPVADLDGGEVVVVPGLTGRLLSRFNPGSAARAPEQVYRSMVSALPEGLAAGDYAESAEDKPAVAVTEATARALGAHDVTALASSCGALAVGSVGGSQESGSSQGSGSQPRTIGTCRLAEPREFADSASLFDALRSGAVDVAWTSTSAPDVPDDVVVLSDRTSLIRAENVVPIYRRNVLTEQQVLALNQVAGELDTGALADMLRTVADGADPGAVAAVWLDSHPLGH